MKIFKEYLSYDHLTGAFKWIKSAPPRGKVGCVAGFDSHSGYIKIGLKGKTCYAHRLAWYFFYGVEPENVIDHINGDPSDNRISNLRSVTQKVNTANRKSIAQGVRLRESGKWQARFSDKVLGTFDKKPDAERAYEEAAKAAGNITKYNCDEYTKPVKTQIKQKGYNLSKIAREEGIPQATLHWRINAKGMTLEQAIKAG